jgi:hypothetical protein
MAYGIEPTEEEARLIEAERERVRFAVRPQ